MAANPEQENETIVSFSLDNKEITSFGDETILQAAKRNNVEISEDIFGSKYAYAWKDFYDFS